MTRRAALLLATLLGVSVVGPWLAPYPPDAAHRAFLYAPPMLPRVVHEGRWHEPFVYPVALTDRLGRRYSEDRQRTRALPWASAGEEAPAFLLGADSLGRDQLSRLLFGARLSLGLALCSLSGALLLGALLGGWAGYAGGWTDTIVMRLIEFVLILPVTYVVLTLRAAMPLVLSPALVFGSMAVIFALVGAPVVARGVRTIIVAERQREHVLAARAIGANGWRVFFHHLLPACAGHLVVQTTLLLPAFILTEATLSYLGLGFPEHVATWGTMLRDAAGAGALTRFPWLLSPALAIFAVVLSANLVLASDKIGGRSTLALPRS